jgi:tRNA(fMet)-specific endonuclease VapC
LIEFLTPLEIVSFDEKAARFYGEIRPLLEKKGRSIGAMDLLIACHAISLSVPLVTNDIRGFKGIPGLQLENWV